MRHPPKAVKQRADTMDTDKKGHAQKNDEYRAAEEVGTVDHAKDMVQVEVSFENRKDLEKKLVRKLDMRLLPLMMLICM